MKKFWIAMLVIVALTVNAQDDDDNCYAQTNAVQVIRVPKDLSATNGLFYYTFTNAGNFRFIVETSRVFQVITEYPFEAERMGGINGFWTMREGDAYEFFLACGWDRGTTHLVFIDSTRSYIPVTRLPAGAFDLYTATAVSTNMQWSFVKRFTNSAPNALYYAPFNASESMRFYSFRQD
jgi:hypothetical protein